jgi:eukaryotic-like serine/threonine-protein kinase
LVSRVKYLRREGKLEDTEVVLRKCLVLREIQKPEDWRTFNTKSELGGTLLEQKKYADAKPLLVAGYEGMKEREATIPAGAKIRLKEALERLVQLSEATGEPDETAQWKQKMTEFDKTRQ